ncbi:MAG: hypothetical protein AAF797_13270 [Planctomycetota bacterium]
MTHHEELATGLQKFMTGHEDFITGHEELKTGPQEFVTGSRKFVTGHQAFGTGHQKLVTGPQKSETGHQVLMTSAQPLKVRPNGSKGSISPHPARLNPALWSCPDHQNTQAYRGMALVASFVCFVVSSADETEGLTAISQARW